MATLNAQTAFGLFGYARVGSTLGTSFGSWTGGTEPWVGFTLDYLITGSTDAMAMVGNTVATFTATSFTVDGVSWAISQPGSFNGTSTDYNITTSGPEFANGVSYAVVAAGAGSQNLTPSLFTNTQTFYAPTVLGPVTLLPSLFSNAPTFYRSIVYAGHTADGDFPLRSTWLLTGRRRFNPQPRKITGLAAKNSAHPAAWTDWLFFPSSGGQTLSPALLTNTQTFYAPTVAQVQVLSPSLFSNAQSFFAPTVTRGAVSLTASLFANSQSFYAATVTRGAVSLTPSLFTNSQSFPAATVTATYSLAPALLTNAQAFYGPTVSPGAVTLSPTLLSNTQSFYGPTVTQSAIVLSPSLVVNAQSFFSPSISASNSMAPPLVSNAQTFYAPTVSSRKNLSPPFYANDNSFFPATVSLANQVLRPDLFVNGGAQVAQSRMWQPFMQSFAA
ncbi:hypothetical protein [Sphingopyxis sp. C-1]|uniref:hypothetical protein n=1 Tax=Sphingopyxis sp. C-1 TaxID=262667 RepID=UPI0006C61B4E|nr:hypothetical protein [Sphingopyxis sp. C-1]GAO78650.1 hypothetical protein SC1_01959 [Sphingopyxis sp. C-1]